MGTTSHDHRLAQHRKNGFSEEARPNLATRSSSSTTHAKSTFFSCTTRPTPQRSHTQCQHGSESRSLQRQRRWVSRLQTLRPRSRLSHRCDVTRWVYGKLTAEEQSGLAWVIIRSFYSTGCLCAAYGYMYLTGIKELLR